MNTLKAMHAPKRLTLDLFQEKKITSEVDLNKQGGTTLPCVSVSLAISVIVVATGGNGCGSDDCHSE